MKGVQFKHPSDSMYQTAVLTDVSACKSRHYAIAVDIYDRRTEFILTHMLSVFHRDDVVTLITFGEHTEMDMILMSNRNLFDKVKSMYSRKEVGLNTLVGVRALEYVDADVYIMVSAGWGDIAPAETLNSFTHKKLHVFSPGTSHMNYMNAAHVVYFPKSAPYQRIIRKHLNILPPNFCNVKLQGSFGIMYAKAPAMGGQSTIHLPFGVCKPLHVSYMTKEGKIESFDCAVEDDPSLLCLCTPQTLCHMRECDMIE